VSHRDLFAKIKSLPLAPGMVFFQSLSKTHESLTYVKIGTKTDLKTDSLRSLKTPILSPRSAKAHAELCLFY